MPTIDARDQVQHTLAGFRQAGLGYADYLNSRPAAADEAVVRLKIAEPLLAALGYDLQADLDPEHRIPEGAIDILVKANGFPAMLWELKRTQETDLARHEDQLTRYALAKGVTHTILCNGREIRVYHRAGDTLRFAYAVPLSTFAPDTLVPPTPDEEMALAAFFDAFRKEAFLEAERMKAEIAITTIHPLILDPANPQNETLLIEDLKREIRYLHRLILLRFRSHQALYRAFQEEKAQRESQAAQTQEQLWREVRDFVERSHVQADMAALEAYLADFTERWTVLEEDPFVEGFIGCSGLAAHLKGTNIVNFRLRAQAFYRAYTDLARWQARQQVKLRPSQTLMENFTFWQDEIGLMAEDYEAEFCLQTVYIFVTRLLLIRICEDKGLITQKISDGGYKDYLDFSRRFFTNIADAHTTLLEIAYKDTSYIYGHFFSHDIFDWTVWEEEAIVRLFWTLNQFDFTQVSADLIGHIYEQYVDELERKRKGQFYTPPQVVNYILDQVGYEGPGIIGKRLLDPACGSGRFLVEAARRLIAELKQQPGLLPKDLVNERLRNAFFGLDINRFACFLAEVNLLVQVLDLIRNGSSFTIGRFHIYPTNTLLPRERDTEALVGPDNGLAYETEVAELIKRRGYNPALGLDFRAGFDWVVGNPPYVRADSPGAATLRSWLQATGQYKTLYKKWDLYIPFIEFALHMLAVGGRHGFIVSDAYQTEEYARRSREALLAQTTIQSVTFAPGVRFFAEAQVHNLIYTVRQGAPPAGHRVKRYQAVAAALQPHDLKTLPALVQARWGEQVFRMEFTGEEGLDFSECVELGEICYINGGLELQSHEKYDPIIGGRRHKLFVKDDLLSPRPSKTHTRPYVEAGDMERYALRQVRWLEWGTDRVPAKLRRPRFLELFHSEKIMVARITADHLTAFYDGKQHLVTNHTVIVNVPYRHLLAVKPTVAHLLARQLAPEEVEQYSTGAEQSKTEVAERAISARAQRSAAFDARFLTAMLNLGWLSRYVMATLRRGRLDFYPDDLKQYPIAPADADTQARIARLVDEIMAAKADVQRWREQGHRVDEGGIVLNPRPFLDTWSVPHGDLVDAAGFVVRQVAGHPTELTLEGQRLIFRKQPLSYFESEHPHVLSYLRLYLETNRDALSVVPIADLPRHICIPRSPQAVQAFLDKLAAEREQVLLRWLIAAQHEALIEELAFDLYDVSAAQREKLGGRLYTFSDLPPDAVFVSILDNEEDNPMRRVAFPTGGAWHYRAAQALPPAVLLWWHDGQQTTWQWRIVQPELP